MTDNIHHTPKTRDLRRDILLPVWIAVNVMMAAVMVFTAYAGCIDPEKMPFAGLAGMTFAGWWIVNIVILVIDLFCCRLLAVLPIAALLICLKPMWAFCPLNFGSHELTSADSARSFKLMSYNVLGFIENQPDHATPDYNRTMHSILASGADIVAIAEYDNMGPLHCYVPQSQIDSLNNIYPYFVTGAHGNALYSKTPIMYVQLPSQQYASGSHEVYRTVIDGKGIMIFGVHLVSFGLDASDKSLYRELTEMETDSVKMGNVRSQLIGKLYGAFRQRNVQAQYIREYVEQLSDENIIVCGDFNDVPDCRAIRILKKTGLKDAYSEVGCGPMITFNDSRLWFRIDHVMYKGDFKPVSIERGNVASSDHYPLLTTFVWTD